MRIYLAGNVGLVAREKKNVALYKRRLVSFFYISPAQSEHKVFQWLKIYLRRKGG